MNSPRAFLFLALASATFTSGFLEPLHAAPGDVDSAFNPNASNLVTCAVTQPDGRILLGGSFTTLQPNGAATATTRNRLARLNADGTIDPAFGPTFNAQVNGVALQADGRMVVVGSFSAVQPTGASTATARNSVARLNADGTLDTGFNPNANGEVYGAVLQTDGKIVVVGSFTTLQPNGATSATTRNHIARLNADGSLDATFDPNASEDVYCAAVQLDGKVIIGGPFATLQPNGATISIAASNLARLNADGSLDAGFAYITNASTWSVLVQPDGKIVIGGNFTNVRNRLTNGITPRNYIARLNTDGTPDAGFDPNAGARVQSLALQTDGKILLGGLFATLQPNGAAMATTRNRAARLNADGTLDAGFNPNANTTGNGVYSLSLQADGKMLLGGAFTTLQPNGAATATTRNRIARLSNDAATSSLTVPDTGRTQWLRGGASQETNVVSFELSTDGGNTWALLGMGTRIAGGWELTGLSLPFAGQVRARGRLTGGYFNNSSGVTEQVVSYSLNYPDIAVEKPVGTGVADGGSVSLGEAALESGGNGAQTFVIRNPGNQPLTLGTLVLSGTNASDFVLNTGNLGSSVPSGGSTTFTISFAPRGTASSARSATLQISSNVSGSKNPYDIALSGLGLSTTADGDGDGLNDHAEYLLSSLGFDWQVGQPALVQTYYNAASSAGLYTTAQVQALYVGAPLIQWDASTGLFKLTIAVQQSADLRTYTPLSLATGTTTINSAGALEFRFNSTSGAQFYRLLSQ